MNPTISSRRHFLRTVSVSALATLAPTSILAQAPAGRKWTLNLVGGAIGVNVGQKEIITLAQKYGFDEGVLFDLSKASFMIERWFIHLGFILIP